MHRYTRLLLTSLAATAMLAMAVSNASAGRLSIDTKENRIVWSRLTLNNTAGFRAVLCQVTLEGSFHSNTIQKTPRALIGYISRAQVNTCTNGNATIDQESLPWHLTYEGFTGTLPRIETLRILLVRASFLISLGELICRAVTTTTDNATDIVTLEGTEKITNFEPDAARRIPLGTVRGFGCGLGRGFFESPAASITRLNLSQTPLIRLI